MKEKLIQAWLTEWALNEGSTGKELAKKLADHRSMLEGFSEDQLVNLVISLFKLKSQYETNSIMIALMVADYSIGKTARQQEKYYNKLRAINDDSVAVLTEYEKFLRKRFEDEQATAEMAAYRGE